MTPAERELLERTARGVLALQEELLDRVAGVELILHELFRSEGCTDIALARLRIRADLLRMNGKPSDYLEAFLEDRNSAGGR